MQSSAVALTSVLEGCDQAKLPSVPLGKGSHAGTPKLLGNHPQMGTGMKSEQTILPCSPFPAPECCSQGGKGSPGQHRPLPKVTLRAAPAQLPIRHCPAPAGAEGAGAVITHGLRNALLPSSSPL